MMKFPEKLKGYNQYEAIKLTLKNVVYDALNPNEFEEGWNLMIENYNLHANDWLSGLYSERHRWVPIFVKDFFWAGMSATHCSGSINSFFDGYVNAKTTLKQFVEQYENALRSKVEKETNGDFYSFNSRVPCITHYHMEKQFQNAYTNSKFKEFQIELTGKMYCEVSLVRVNDDISEFEVSEDMMVGGRQKCVNFQVWFKEDQDGYDIKSTSCLFEFKGILCRHIIEVLTHRKIYSIFEKYILKRWRKDVKRCYTRVKISYADWNGKPEAQKFHKMVNRLSEVADLAVECEEANIFMMDTINKCKVVVEKILRNVGESSQSTSKLTAAGNYGSEGKCMAIGN